MVQLKMASIYHLIQPSFILNHAIATPRVITFSTSLSVDVGHNFNQVLRVC